MRKPPQNELRRNITISAEDLQTICRLIDFRITKLRASFPHEAPAEHITEVVDLTKFRLKIQQELDEFYRQTC